MNDTSDRIQIPETDAMRLKERWLLFLEARLLGEAAFEEWKRNMRAVALELMQAPLSMLVDAGALNDALDAALSAQAVQKTLRPLAQSALGGARAEMLKQPGRVGDLVSPAAKEKINKLLERPDVFPEKLARHVVMHEASEEMMRDVLFDALKEFSERVNPFVAEWGLPALIKKMSPFGLGGFQKSLASMQADFDKRLEPEIRKFLQGFSKKALTLALDEMIAKSGEPKAAALRKSIFEWLLSQELARLAHERREGDVQEINSIGLDIAEHVFTLPEVRVRRRAFIEGWLKENGHKSVHALCQEWGIERDAAAEDAFWEAAARAAFPLLKAALGSPSAKRWLKEMVDAFFDENVKSISSE